MPDLTRPHGIGSIYTQGIFAKERGSVPSVSLHDATVNGDSLDRLEEVLLILAEAIDGRDSDDDLADLACQYLRAATEAESLRVAVERAKANARQRVTWL